MNVGLCPCFLAAAWLAGGTLSAAGVAEVHFNRDIRPILSQQCFACHGPDQNARKAKLRLDRSDDARAPHKHGHPIVPGKPDESELWRRVNSTDPDEQMPPPKSGKYLSGAQRELLRAWLEQGARYEGHWAFLPLVRPAVPEVKLGSLSGSGELSPLDAFVMARLQQEGLTLSPEAERRALIRRVSFDLTGLPPRAEDVEAFVRSKDTHAYEKLVDRLLASPQYGERMAAYWLDLVRYGDTVGYHGDCDYSVWPYRDYVIRAFNENYSFARFIREQLAGDLLPGATVEQRVASGYNRLNRVSTEGGVQDKEYLAKYASDRVRTTSTVWMGATFGCAECHDHKFDPFATRDFYRFSAFFADLKEKGFYDKGFSENDWGPRMPLPNAEQEKTLRSLDARLAELKKKRDRVRNDELATSRARWESQVLAWSKTGALGWTNVTPLRLGSKHGARLETQTNQAVLVSGPLPDDEEYTALIPGSLPQITALRLEILKDSSLPGNDIARSGQTFVLGEIEVGVGERSRTENQFRRVSLDGAAADFSYEGFPVLAAIDGHTDTGWSQGSGPPRDRRAVFHFAEPVRGGSNVLLSVRLRHNPHYPRQHIGKFRLALASMNDPSIDPQGVPEDVLKALKVPATQRTNEQSKAITNYFRAIAPELRGWNRRVAELSAQREQLKGGIPTMLVSEAVKPRVVRMLPRGNWMDESGQVVQPGVPQFLGPLRVGHQDVSVPPNSEAQEPRATRLDLANWFTSPDNPLTARVFVNRLWKLFFGTGLSKTLDDLGAQGEWPTHPELLDWLACEFGRPDETLSWSGDSPRAMPPEVVGRWDVKHMVRLIVTSRVYRQSSRSSAILEDKDPFNRLLARQSRFRLDAEMIRDNALAVAGLLVNRQGGPSVRPYQPEGYYGSLNFPRREYVAGQGDELYRRSLYTHWQRTFLHPSLLAFDAPPREECTAARVNSNTPQQALVLLNDPIYVEAARVFAENIMRRGGRTFEQRLDWAFTRALARPARPAERRLMEDLFQKQRTRFQAEPAQAAELIHTGQFLQPHRLDPVELAAWTSVARALLNLHEVITRD